MSLRRAGAVALRILQQFRRDRRTLALLFLAPIIILSLIGYLLRGGGQLSKVDVVNLDAGPVAAQIDVALKRSSGVSATDTDLTAARRDLDAGAVAGYIVLPSGLSQDFLTTREVRAEAHLEGSQPGPSQGVLQALQQATESALATLGGADTARVVPRISYLHGGSGLDSLDYLGAAMIGISVFFLVFVITSVSFLRERVQGTLERLMATPIRRGEIVTGYMLGFTVAALAQGLVVLLFALNVLRVHNAGNPLLVFLVEALLALGAVNLGIFVSMFANTEFQAVQFIPLVITPQLILSGIIFPVETEPAVLHFASEVLPLTYGVYAMRDVMIKGAGLGSAALQFDMGVLALFCVVAAIAAAFTLRRRVA